MEAIRTEIEGVWILEPRVFNDARGYFFESFSARDFERLTGERVSFVQDNQARSEYGVLRGLHFQRAPYAQAKLVRVTEGRVLDVAVDLRAGSPTLGKHVAVELSADNFRQLYIPKGFAHGYVVLSPSVVFQYKTDEYYHPEAEGGVRYDDPDLAVDWRLSAADLRLSDKDLRLPSYASMFA